MEWVCICAGLMLSWSPSQPPSPFFFLFFSHPPPFFPSRAEWQLHRMETDQIMIPDQRSLVASLPPPSADRDSHDAFPVNPVCIAGFFPEVEIIPSLARPKKIAMMVSACGEDGGGGACGGEFILRSCQLANPVMAQSLHVGGNLPTHTCSRCLSFPRAHAPRARTGGSMSSSPSRRTTCGATRVSWSSSPS